MSKIKEKFEDVTPDPAYLVKSIAEQGYTLETALADLIDNSISATADKIEILAFEKEDGKLRLILADNGLGMNEVDLRNNLKFPSSDLDDKREKKDLGRFGMGLKTASFSQTRKFTVLSRPDGELKYNARTWDVDLLANSRKWKIIIEDENSIKSMVKDYISTSETYQHRFEAFSPNTIVIWDGLYKFNDYFLKTNQYEKLRARLNNVTSEYLGTIFHRFIEREKQPVSIKINHRVVESFNPFADVSSEYPIQFLAEKTMAFGVDHLKMKGAILPVEATKSKSAFTTANRSLSDLEGLYIYREDRIIYYGGWNGLVRRGDKFKLARLYIQVGNTHDDLLQLNVAKSKITIPFELLEGVTEYIQEIRAKSVLELSKRGLKSKSKSSESENIGLLSKILSSKKGAVYLINENYPVLKILNDTLNAGQKVQLRSVLKSINFLINDQKSGHTEFPELIDENVDDEKLILETVQKLSEQGLDMEQVYDIFLREKGYENNNIPELFTTIFK
jgi:hypothetical protein